MIGAITAGLYGGATAPLAGNFYSIQTQTVGAGGASSVTFTGIPSTYKHLQVRAITHRTGGTADDNTNLQMNSDTGANYSWHQLYGDGTNAAAGASASTTSIRAIPDLTSATGFGAGVVDILDYANTSKYKTTRILTGYDNNGSGYILFRSGLWQNTAAITSLTFTPNSGSFAQYTTFALYGVL